MNAGSDEDEGSQFEYDVAFSFVAADEPIALQIADLLSDRSRVFIYSRAQEHLAGRDGENKFNEIFSKQSRVVVVLCRPEWGQTPFTRIEETAIKNRAFNEGYDFALFVPMTSPPNVPRYVPKTRLYGNIERFGLQGIAAAIEQLIRANGGSPRTETVQDRSARLQRELGFQGRRRQFLTSQNGNERARGSAAVVLDAAQAWAIREEGSLGSQVSRNQNAQPAPLTMAFRASVKWLWVRVSWRHRFINNLDEAGIWVEVFEDDPSWHDRYGNPLRPVTFWRFEPDLAETGEVIWSEISGGSVMTAQNLADKICRLIMDEIERHSRAK